MHERGCQEGYLVLGKNKVRKHSRVQGTGGGVVPKGVYYHKVIPGDRVILKRN